MSNSTIRILGVLLVVAAPALSACGSLKETIGLAKKPPDEFAVSTNQPLALPPDFRLRPPAPGTTGPSDVSAAERARQTVFRTTAGRGQGTIDTAGKSRGEVAILTRIGAEQITPDIREKVNAEAGKELDPETIEVLRKALGITN